MMDSILTDLNGQPILEKDKGIELSGEF